MTKGKQIVSFIFVLLLIPIGWNGINQVSGQNRKRPPRNNSLDRHDRAKPIVVHLRVGSDSVEVLEADMRTIWLMTADGEIEKD